MGEEKKYIFDIKKFKGKINKKDWRIWNFSFSKDWTDEKCKKLMVDDLEKRFPEWAIIPTEIQVNLSLNEKEKLGVICAYKFRKQK